MCSMQKTEGRGPRAQGGGAGEAAGEAEDEVVAEAHRVSCMNTGLICYNVRTGSFVTAFCARFLRLGGRGFGGRGGSAVKAARDGNIQEFKGSKITFD